MPRRLERPEVEGVENVDRASDGFEEVPERCGGAVAEDRAVAASEDGGHPAPVPAQALVSHGVDATVDAVELTSRSSLRRAPASQARLFELEQHHHAVLTSRDFRYASIRRVAFVPHEETKSTRPGTLPPYPAFFVPESATRN
jgi:hypothetical protein